MQSNSKSANCDQKYFKNCKENPEETFEEPSLLTTFFSYLGFCLLVIIGHFNQFLFKQKISEERYREGYVPLFEPFGRFYRRYVYRRSKDCVDRAICSVPGDTLVIKDWISRDCNWTLEFTGTETKCINMGSYNYLGFAQNKGPCADQSIEALERYGIAICSPRRELGTNPLHNELEALTAKFLEVEDAIVFGMGFATNALNLPALLSPGCLVISDEKNHASIILGLKVSGATSKIFKHNDMESLENIIQESIISGQPSGEPWKKILIVTEGIFSLEGSIAKLPEIVAIKNKYGVYIYLDEAHSIGSMGPRGRGITDYYGIDPKDIDILMGTFTKAFGSAGGYIAGNKNLINFLRVNSQAACYASSMAPAVAQQIITSMKIIMGLDGTAEGKRRIDQLARNTRYFRKRMKQIGVITYGHEDSPVVPMVGFFLSKCTAFGRRLMERKIAVCGATYPAVALLKPLIRFCISAAHTKEQLDYVLQEIEQISEELGLKYSRKPRDSNIIQY